MRRVARCRWSVLAAVAREGTARPADTQRRRTRRRNVTLTAEQRQRIHLVTVQPTSFRPVVEAPGNVAFNGDRSTQVLSPVSGPATRVVAKPGSGRARAASRSPMCRRRTSPTAVADYRKAQTAYRNAKRIADRDSALFKNDALARGELEQAQTDARVGRSRRRGRRAEHARARRRGIADRRRAARASRRRSRRSSASPIDGTVVEKLIADGQLLQAGSTPCFTVADLSTMWVMANVFANDLPDVARRRDRRRPHRRRAGADPGQASTTSRRSPIRARRRWRFASSRRTTTTCCAATCSCACRSKRRTSITGLLVPVSAVLRDDQNLPFVFVAAANNAFARRRIDARLARRRPV